MKEGLKAFEAAKAINPKLTRNCKYPGKPRGKHCPCHMESRGYKTIARAVICLNGETDYFPRSWEICRNHRCIDEYKGYLTDLVFFVTDNFPTNLCKLCALLDCDRPPEDMQDKKWLINTMQSVLDNNEQSSCSSSLSEDIW